MEWPNIKMDFHIDKSSNDTLINDFLDQCGHIEFLSSDEYGYLFQFVMANKEGFFKNLVVSECAKANHPIIKGMKLLKAFKFFVNNKEALNNIQQLASTYIQKDKISGTLCFSVHPLDYLSASENNYNWRSCHALDGEYRAGNLSYMTDSTTICCYIKGDKEEKLPDFPDNVPWNSKKWRMWIHISEDWNYCFLGRPYPFAIDIIKLIKNSLPGEWENFTDFHFQVVHDEHDEDTKFYLNGNYIVLKGAHGNELFKEHEIIKSGSKLNYNDLLYSSCYKPYYSSKIGSEKPEFPKITVGHPVSCLCCGNDDIEEAGDSMVCHYCAQGMGLYDSVICDCCGSSCSEEEMILVDDTYVCQDCYDEFYGVCAYCNDVHRLEDMTYIEDRDIYICDDCYLDYVDS